MRKLLNLMNMSKNDVLNFLEVAWQMRRIAVTSYKRSPQLVGASVAGVFPRQDIVSKAFALATMYLSGNFVEIYGCDDVPEYCSAMCNMGVDMMVLKDLDDDLTAQMASTVNLPLINAGGSIYSPIEAMADLMALREKLDSLNNLTVLVVGNKNTAKLREIDHVLSLFRSHLVWYLPEGDHSSDDYSGTVVHTLDLAFAGVDAIIDIGLNGNVQPELYYGNKSGILETYIDRARVNAPLLGCKKIVSASGAVNYPYSATDAQYQSLISVAMAALYLMRK